MRIIGRIKDALIGRDAGGRATIVVDTFIHAKMLQDLSENTIYSIEIKEAKNPRTLQQNKYMWELIGLIDKQINGTRSNNEFEIYTMALEHAGAKYEYIGALPEAEPLLKENFRAVQFIKKIDLNGKDGNMYKCYIGSSKMNTKEMGELIDTILDIAEQVGIDTVYWKEVLK